MYQLLLSPYSKIFYTEWRLDQNRSDYNIVFDQELKGKINTSRLNDAIKRLISDYVILNSHIEDKNEELYWVKNKEIYSLEYFKSELTNTDVVSYVRKPFDLEKGPLYRFGLIKCGNNKCRFIVVLHHIIIDGSSYDYFVNELTNYYNNKHYKYCISVEDQLLNISKLSKSLWEQAELSKQESKLFWQDKLASIEPLDLGFLRIGANQKKILNNSDQKSELAVQKLCQIDEIRFDFDKKVFFRLNQLKTQYMITPYLYGQIIYAVLLNRYTGQNRFCISYAFGIKEGRDFIYGAQINTNIIPFDFGKINNIIDIINQSKEFINSLKHTEINHSYLPISDKISLSNKDIIDLAFSQTNLKDKIFEFSNTKISINNHTDIDLLKELFFEQEIQDEQIKYRVRYRLDKIDTGLLNEFLDCYKQLFVEILDELIKIKDINRLCDIKNYNLLSNEQYNQIIHTWNQTDKDFQNTKTLQALFEEQVAKSSDSVAVIYQNDYLTYQELNKRANQLAHYLQWLGVEPNTLIIIAIDRSLEMIIALLGILKAGGAYVPLDLSAPMERIQFILNDIQPPIIITDKNNNDKIPTTFAQVISVNEEWDIINKYSTLNPIPNTLPHDLAYVIYTSGTTGNPKGVMVEHGGVANTILSQIEYLNIKTFIEKPVSCGFFTNYAFDASVAGIFMPLISGHKLVIADELSKLDISEIYYFINKNQINIINCAQILTLLGNNIASLRCLIIGGEKPDKFAIETLNNLGIRIFQEYGLTESSIVSTYNQLDSITNVANIGCPIPNAKCYVLDINLTPLPVGATGELYIGGVGLARGYLNQPGLTAEKFIANPFQTLEEEKLGKHERLYRTGDLVRWLADGKLEYIGRNDFQVKIRGYRIELGEIETALSSYEGIKQSVVLSKERENIEEGLTGNKYLIGYYVSTEKLDEESIINYLRTLLPEYMIPNALVHLEKLPFTVNGKLDRKALPEPELTSGNTYLAPRNELESQMCQIWGEILGIPNEKIGIRDDFFRLGGDSILAIKLVSKLNKELNNSNQISAIFKHNTVEKLVQYYQFKIMDSDTVYAEKWNF